ncbi:MAG: glycoside hydrolase family 76 protein [Clostridia bacterium]|nr:glycoside hydrolase family 76 protein [Clostridia bacterium]
MKRFVFWILFILLVATLAVSCTQGDTTTAPDTTTAAVETTTQPATTVPETTEEPKLLIADSKGTAYQLIAPEALLADESFSSLLADFSASIASGLSVKADSAAASELEILVGTSSREESASEDSLYYTHIKLVEKKLVFTGENPTVLREALLWFQETYITDDGVLQVPLSLNQSFSLDMSYSAENEKTFEAIAKEVYDSFNAKYFVNGWVAGHAYWDKAEMIETYIDVYEAAGTEEARANMLSYANLFAKLYSKNWSRNEYNDDIMWACIAFTRIAKLCDKSDYLEIAKTNFDLVWERAYDDTLGGGLYWRIENTTKNSCVNCPGAIAACLIGEMTGDKTYYEKASLLMQWEFDNLFEEDTGRVYDAYSVSGNINKWASTYNQGTFIGACTLLHEYYGDAIYLEYAAKAADYAMTHLTNDDGIIDNKEASTSNNDLPGFKGILVRWLYRYAKYTDDLDILAFLQANATHTYQMRNDAGIIWTDWTKPTLAQRYLDQGGYVTFGMSTAVALMYNCLPWW